MTFPYMYKKNNDGTSSTLTIYVDGRAHTILSSAANFTSILTALKNGVDDDVRKFLNFKKTIADYSCGLVELYGDELYFNNAPLHNAISQRIIELYREGFDIKAMSKFLENLMKNPSKNAIDELYLFLEFTNLPITDDGYFLAYRVVNNDYKDKHTNSMDNSVGSTVRMDRNDCDSDRNRTCSTGLHFCSRDYVAHFYSPGDRLLVMKINPKDVVSIPADYNNSKGRCCEFYVQEEIHNLDDMKKWYHHSANEESEEFVEEEDDNNIDIENDEILKTANIGKNSYGQKLTDKDIPIIRKMLKEKFTLKVIADTFKVHPRTIARIRDGEIWVLA